MKVIALVSGGMDSVTMAYLLAAEKYEVTIFSVDYGQRHQKELVYASMAAKSLGVPHELVDLSHLLNLFRGSALTDSFSVPDGHYTDEKMAITVVPNRNVVLFSLAFAFAVSHKAEVVATAVHSGDHTIYPDCRADFIETFSAMERLANKGYAHPDLRLYAPFVSMDKAQIVSLGNQLRVPFEQTWSCYKGDEFHCGTCGTCVERKEAFERAKILDPTIYKKEEKCIR